MHYYNFRNPNLAVWHLQPKSWGTFHPAVMESPTNSTASWLLEGLGGASVTAPQTSAVKGLQKLLETCWKQKLDIHMRGRVAIWDNDHSGIGDDQDTTTRNRHDKTLHRKNFLLYPCWKDSIASIYGSPQKFPKWIVLCKLQEVVKLYYSAKLEPWWKSWMPPPQLSHFELNFGRPSSTRRASTILRMPDKLVYLESSFAGFVCRKCWSNEKTYWIWGSLTWEPKEVHLSCQDVLWPSMVRHVPLTYRDASRHSRLQCCGRSGCDASARDLSHWWPSPWTCHVETTIVLPWPCAPVNKDLWNIPTVSRVLCWGVGDVFLSLRQLKWCGFDFGFVLGSVVLDCVWSRIELDMDSWGFIRMIYRSCIW